MLNVAVDLGGTRTKVGVLKDGELLGCSMKESFSQDDFTVSIARLKEQINELLSEHAISSEQVDGVGLAFPGLVDVMEKKVISTNAKYDQAGGFNFTEWAAAEWGAKFAIENDARAALVGEWQSGVGKGVDNIVMMTIGTGIGGVCLMKGKLLLGAHFQAGVLGGHFTVNYHGGRCSCGNLGCVEAEASTWRIAELIKGHGNFSASLLADADKLDYKALFEAAAKDDPLASELLEKSLNVWAAGLVNMIHAYDPEMVILHGGVMADKDIILPYVEDYIKKYAWTPWGEVKVEASSSTDYAALYGMDFLCRGCIEELYF